MATGATGPVQPVVAAPAQPPTTPADYVLPASSGPQHIPPSGPVTSITKATLKTSKDTVDVLDQIPPLCGGSVTFPVMPIYTATRAKKVLTTTPEDDTVRGFPVVQLEIVYVDKDGTHTDEYALNETATLGQYTTLGQVQCTPQTLVWNASLYASYGVVGFLVILMFLTNMVYTWKLWDGYAANRKTIDPSNEVGMSYIVTTFVKWTASPITKFIAVIIAALAPIPIAFLNAVMTATTGYMSPPQRSILPTSVGS